jgi:hypothetical protein
MDMCAIIITLHQLVWNWGRTSGKRSKTQEKRRKVTEEESS